MSRFQIQKLRRWPESGAAREGGEHIELVWEIDDAQAGASGPASAPASRPTRESGRISLGPGEGG